MMLTVPSFFCNDTLSIQRDTCGTQCNYSFEDSSTSLSIIQEWGLICEHALCNVPDTLFMVGYCVGTLVGAALADVIGRRLNGIVFLLIVTVSHLLC